MEGTLVGHKYVYSASGSMHKLLIKGVFVDNLGRTVNTIAASGAVYVVVFFVFVIFAALVVMNMGSATNPQGGCKKCSWNTCSWVASSWLSRSSPSWCLRSTLLRFIHLPALLVGHTLEGGGRSLGTFQ